MLFPHQASGVDTVWVLQLGLRRPKFEKHRICIGQTEEDDDDNEDTNVCVDDGDAG